MFSRLLEKDVRVALQKIEKLPLEQIRKVTKDVGGNKEGGSDASKCEKCDKILAKLFPAQDTRHTVYATSARNEAEKLEQKLETIEERTLIESESKSKDLDFPPKVLGQNVLQPSNIQRSWHSAEDATLDELARKIMNSPPQEIDRKILQAYNYTTLDTYQMERDELSFKPMDNRATEVSRDVNDVLLDGVNESTFPHCRQEYSVHMVDENTNRTWKAECPQPTHYGAEYPTYIEKGTLRHKVLRELEELGALVPQNELMLVPLPPNQTSISSCDPSPESKSESANNAESTAISAHTLPRVIEKSSRGERKNERNDKRKSPEFVTYFSAPVTDTATNKVQLDRKVDFDRIPLSVLLKWTRQRSMKERETKKDRTWKGARYLSKGSCLPPLDNRPRSNTCSPRACPSKKKETCPPPKNPCSTTKSTCPPQKMPCPPPKTTACPPPKDPCAKSSCDPCKQSPCPPKQKPCGLIIGNRIKETISLILSAYGPLSPKRSLTTVDITHIRKSSMSTVVLCPEMLVASPLLVLRRWSDHHSERSPHAQKLKSVALSRSFDPWTPIPSWPIPKKLAQKKLICPKEGCPPVKLPKDPCKEQPCETAKHRKFSTDYYSYW